MTCPCGKGESIEVCCGPILSAQRQAETAEELMRARYTAYATNNVDFVISSHDPATSGEVDRVGHGVYVRPDLLDPTVAALAVR